MTAFTDLVDVASARLGARIVGCNDEFIQSGDNGFLCDPFEEQPWIDALTRLSNSPDLRKAIGYKGHQTCRRLFNIRDTAARFEQVYADLAV